MSGGAAGDENWSVRDKVKILLKFIKDLVGVVDEIGFGQDDDDSLAGFDDLAGESLVELGMILSGVDEESANIGFLDGSESADGGKLFDTNFALAGFAEAGGIENFEGAIMKTNFDAIDVTRGSLARADEGLLFLA